jgi:RNA polymerase sigma factor (sigma-70 family)
MTSQINLIIQAKNGDNKAIEKLLLSVRGRIYAYAKRWGKCEVEDLVQEGLIGAFHAIKKFDVDSDTCFKAYASFWWKQYIRLAAWEQVARGRSGNLDFRASNSSKITRILESVPEGEDKALALEKGLKVGPSVANGILAMLEPTFSVDAMEFQDGVLRDDSHNPDDYVCANEIEKKVRCAYNSLSPKLRSVIELRYLGKQELTLEAVGERSGISKQAAHRQEAEAFKLLKRRLKEFDLV